MNDKSNNAGGTSDTRPKIPPSGGFQPKTLFYSYSQKDEELRNELDTHLILMKRQGILSSWHDRKIWPGEEWNSAIDRNLEQADIILLLISADFMASDYIWNNEVKRAMDRHAQGQATVVPVLLRPCDWQSAPFGKLQGLPKEMKAVIDWPHRDSAWANVAQGIRTIIQDSKSDTAGSNATTVLRPAIRTAPEAVSVPPPSRPAPETSKRFRDSPVDNTVKLPLGVLIALLLILLGPAIGLVVLRGQPQSFVASMVFVFFSCRSCHIWLPWLKRHHPNQEMAIWRFGCDVYRHLDDITSFRPGFN